MKPAASLTRIDFIYYIPKFSKVIDYFQMEDESIFMILA